MRHLLATLALIGVLLSACVPGGAPTPGPGVSTTTPEATAVASAAPRATTVAPSTVVAAQTAPASSPAQSPTATKMALIPLSEEALKNAEYTVCGDKVRLKDGAGITDKPGLDYARQCKASVERIVFGDLNGDRLDDAVVILYSFERSHRIPSIHAFLDENGQPREVAFEELPWEKQVTEVNLVDREARVTLVPDPPRPQTPETLRVELPIP